MQLRAERGPRRLRLPAVVGGVAAAGWVVWNVAWLASGHLPPSLLYHSTGVPVATTGFTRSLRALARGDLAESVCWNAFSVPIVALYVTSFALLGVALVRRTRPVLPPLVARAWLVVLAAAWIVKLVQAPHWI